MKLEVGMYVRTKGGFIDKIISFKSTISNDYVELEDEYYANKKDIVKASNNIIDLIEAGDYVNGIRVTSVHKTVDDNVLIGLGDTFGFSKFDNDYQIKTIVTSQQFESMQYEVN